MLNESEIGLPEDYEHIADYEEYKTWFYKKIRKAHRTIEQQNDAQFAPKSYAIRKGLVRVGGK